MKFERLGNITEITSGGTPLTSKREYYDNGIIPWVKTGDLKVRHLSKIPGAITQLGLENSSAKIFPINTVLVAMYGATIGACSILKTEASTNQACAAILPTKEINEEYLFFYLSAIKPELIRKGVGGGQPNISATILKDTKIFLPALADQIRIAKIMSSAEVLTTQRKESIGLLDEYLKSLFLEMFGDPVRNEKGWEQKKLQEHIIDILAGSSYGGEAKDFLEDTELGVLKVSAVTWGTFNPKEIKAVRKDLITKKIIHPQKGDLLFSRANTRELVGATCIVDDDYPNLFLPDKIWKLILNTGALNNYYLHFLLQDKNFKLKLTNDATGSSGSMLNISMEKLRQLVCPIPPITLQNKFASIVEKTESLKKQYKQSLQELENLFFSLSQRAFKGELNIEETVEYAEIIERGNVPVGNILNLPGKRAFEELISYADNEPFPYIEKDSFLDIIHDNYQYKIKELITKKTFTPDDEVEKVYVDTFGEVVSKLDSKLKLSKYRTWITGILMTKIKLYQSDSLQKQIIRQAELSELESAKRVVDFNRIYFTNYRSYHMPALIDYVLIVLNLPSVEANNLIDETLQIAFYKTHMYILSKPFEKIVLGKAMEAMNENPRLMFLQAGDNLIGNEKTDTSSGDNEQIDSEPTDDILPWDETSYEQIANWLKKQYTDGSFFSLEMASKFLTTKYITDLDYYSSEELKRKPKLNESEDFKAFIFSAIANENPFLGLEQHFYNDDTQNFDLVLNAEDLEMIRNRSSKEKSGIYFRIIQS